MSEKVRSSMTLRNRMSMNTTLDYNDLMNTPIGRKSRRATLNKAPVYTSPKIRNRKQLNTPVKSDRDEDSDDVSSPNSPAGSCSNNSNQENLDIQQLDGEARPSSRLRRSSRNAIAESFICELDQKPDSIRCTIRKKGSETPTPGRRASKRPMRESVLLKCTSNYVVESDDEDQLESSDDKTPQRTRRKHNRSYFTEKDNEEYCPSDGSEASGEDDVDVTVSESDAETTSEIEDNDEDDDNENITEKKSIPAKLPFNLTKMVLTPEVLKKLEGEGGIKRKLAVDSPVASGSQTMSSNPENYFLAENRIKFKKQSKVSEVVMNDAMKGKKNKRQRLRTLYKEDNLPEKLPSNFSVTTEAMKARSAMESDWKNFIPGNTHDDEVDRLFKNIVDNEFPNWLGLFRDGFNVMVYGYGSKLGLFTEFEKLVNDKYLVVTINGLFPKLNQRKIITGLFEHVKPRARMPQGTNLEALVRNAVSLLENEDHDDIYLLINNFDNMALRSPQMLTVICLLAQIPYVHILASCDTVNAFLGVTQSQMQQLKFCWSHCPTYQQFGAELKWIPGIYGDESRTLTQKSSLKYVLQSLTGNARKAFSLLGQMQLKQLKTHSAKKSKEEFPGVRFQELAKSCREKFIAHSDENLRTLLVEFFDHKLIRQTGKGRHIENTLLIELDTETLEEVLTEL